MSLRAKLALAFIAVVALGVGAALVAAERYLYYAARETLEENLQHDAQVYATFLSERGARRAAETRVVAEEPRLKAAVRTLDIDQATIEDVADELRQASGAELFALTDRTGATVADVSKTKLGDLSQRPEFTQSAGAGGGVAIWSHAGQLFQVAVRPLKFGAETTGYLVTGYRLGDDTLAAARAQTGSEVAVALDGKVTAQALRPGVDAAALPSAPDGVSEQPLGGERFVVLNAAHPMAPAGARLLLARSLDESLAAHQAVRKSLAGIGGITLALGLLAALVLARSLTRRVEQLSLAADRVGKGEVGVKVDAGGKDEVARLAATFNQMTEELEKSRAALIRKERLEKELQIAQQIQTALLPKSLTAPGYRIAASMQPAENVGGDLYDVVVGKDGHVWMCIGDVTSHGVTPGLIMMMVQSALSALIEKAPGESPGTMLTELNRVIYANVHERLRDDNYLTLTLLRSDGPGKFVYAGAHLDLLVRRVSGAIERIPTPGLWVGLVPDIAGQVEEGHFELAIGDTLVLYSDGLTEARDASGNQLDIHGVIEVLKTAKGAEPIRDALFARVRSHMVKQDDDVTVVAVERVAD